MSPRCLCCHCAAAVGKDDAHAAHAFENALQTELDERRRPPWRRSVTAATVCQREKEIAAAVYQLSHERRKIVEHQQAEAERIATGIARKELNQHHCTKHSTNSRPLSARAGCRQLPSVSHREDQPECTVTSATKPEYYPRILPSELSNEKPRTVADHFKRMRPLTARKPSNMYTV